MKEIIVIGGGIGGLMSGALLSKNGFRVTVLEKNLVVGGGLQCFKRNGTTFAPNMHVFGGFQEDGSLRKICQYLGIFDRLSLRFTDRNAFDVVTFLSDGKTYNLPIGKDNYVSYLAQEFPSEKNNIKEYVDELYGFSEEEDLYYLREGNSDHYNHSDRFFWPVDQLIDHHFSDPKLKSLLYYMSPLYGGVPGQTPAYINALLSILHINGSCQFNDDSQQMANLLVEVIETAGGHVMPNKEVDRIEIDSHYINQVHTKDGCTYQADAYISDVPPDVLLGIVDRKAFTPSFRNRISEVPDTYSSFSVFVKFKEHAFPYINHVNFCLDDYDRAWHLCDPETSRWPEGLMYITPPLKEQGDYANTLIANCVMDFECVRRWENTRVGQRGPEYEIWKQHHLDMVLDKMESVYPDFRNCIDFCFASSPLTIRDYCGNKDGSLYGFRKDCNNMALSQLSVFTKVKNLYLTGQNVNLHGFCGVSLTAIETAEALLGRNEIVRQINNHITNI